MARRQAKQPTRRRPRGSLSREEILDRAQQLVERQGLHQLSMPALAKQLRSGVTSIYWYFRSKDDLIVALAERVAKEMYTRLPPVGDGPWESEVIEYFAAFRDLMLRTPTYREVFIYRSQTLLAGSLLARSLLHRLDSGLALFVDAGLTPEQAADAFVACSNYTRGFIVLEHGYAAEQIPDSVVEGMHQDLARLDPQEFPPRARMGDIDAVVGLDDSHFRTGLQLLLRGIRRQFGLADLGQDLSVRP